MSWLSLNINHRCPYCNAENHLLKCYTVSDESSFIDVGDYILNNLDTDIGFVTAEGYCNYCSKSYICKVGVMKSRLTDIVIMEKGNEGGVKI